VRTITCASLSGGQGKTTTALMLGRSLTRQGYRVLMVDADPQASLTFYLGQDIDSEQPSLLEVLKKQVPAEEAIYPLGDLLALVPADEGLDNAQDYLATSGMGATLMRRRLQAVASQFDCCVIDAPPQRSQLCLTAIGAADELLIPAEASSKGLNSLLRTLDLVSELTEIEAFQGHLLGILPFRDRWLGRTQAKQSQRAIEGMQAAANLTPVLPSILESEQFKKAIDLGQSLSDLGYEDLEYPFQVIVGKLSLP
jgi:chromosome partitioning protein